MPVESAIPIIGGMFERATRISVEVSDWTLN